MKIVSNKAEWPEALAYFSSIQAELWMRGYALTGIDQGRYTLTVTKARDHSLTQVGPPRVVGIEELSQAADDFEARLKALSAEVGG